MKTISVSAPGKLHILGEHTVVYGKPAILAAVDKRCSINIAARTDSKIKIISKDFQKEIIVTSDTIVEKTKQAQSDWEHFYKTNDIEILKRITKKPFDYPMIIIGEVCNFLKVKRDTGFTVTIRSEIPAGCGMGSSAALAVSLVSGLYLYFGNTLDKKVINEIAFLAEQKKHGQPSGGDNTASCYGGLLWFQKEKSHFRIDPLSFSLPLLIRNNFYIVNTGKPEETTGEMIHHVKLQAFSRSEILLCRTNPLAERDPALQDKTQKRTMEIFDDQEKLVQRLSGVLENGNEKELLYILRAGEKNLEGLGVVSASVQDIITDIEKSGGAAKICGGGGKVNGTGILLCYHANENVFKDGIKKRNLQYDRVILGADGVRED